MARTLRIFGMVMGVSCALIGVYHFILGSHSVPGEGGVGATVDSRERVYSAYFFAYGLAWIWVSRQHPISAKAVRLLAGLFLLGAVGRLISLADYGWPHWMQSVEGAIELVFPFIFFALAPADERAAARAAAQPADPTPARPTVGEGSGASSPSATSTASSATPRANSTPG